MLLTEAEFTFIRTSEWETHGVTIEEKKPDGSLEAIKQTAPGGMSRDLSIKGIRVGDGGATLRNMDRSFVLKPNTCVVLETREHIRTGPKVMGFICSRASLASKGLIVSNLKVDPNYSDTLYITVFNAGTGVSRSNQTTPSVPSFSAKPMEPATCRLVDQTRKGFPVGGPRNSRGSHRTSSRARSVSYSASSAAL